MGRSYNVGSRRPDLSGRKKREDEGRMSQNRWAWVKNAIGQFVIFVNEDANDKDDFSIKLFHPIPSRPAVSWNLTALTEEELLTFKQLIDLAFEWSLPIVQKRDKEAQDAFNRGDDSYIRVYRQVPQLVIRKRPEREHSESVSERPDWFPQMDGAGINPDAVLRGSSDELAQSDETTSSTQDDGAQTDDSA